MAKGAGKRYNKGKNRQELLPTRPVEMISDVYTKGAHKYSVYRDPVTGAEILGKDIPLEEAYKYELIDDGSDNWRKGLSWREATGSVKRHITAFENGEDFDPEINTYHLANAAWGLMVLLEQYKTHPELDDRVHRYLTHPKIGLDIDNVLADWCDMWGDKFGVTKVPTSWSFDYKNSERFNMPKEELEALYKAIPPMVNPNEIPFEPVAYVTARSVDVELTKDWLQRNGFPCRPVHTVPFGASKVDVAKQAGIEWFIDDSYDNFVELNKAGICTFLWDAPHNRRYEVGYKRITSFKDFKERFL